MKFVEKHLQVEFVVKKVFTGHRPATSDRVKSNKALGNHCAAVIFTRDLRERGCRTLTTF